MNLKEMDQKFLFRVYLDTEIPVRITFLQIQKFSDFMQFHMIKFTTYKGPDSCYVLPRFPSSCFLGQVTGLFFCLYVEFFASAVYALLNC